MSTHENITVAQAIEIDKGQPRGPCAAQTQGAEMTEQMTIAEAQAALDDAMMRCKAAEEALKAAPDEVDLARSAVRQARLRADADLPRATMVLRSRHSEDARREVVIVRRTAKLITVKYPGDTNTRKFRLAAGDRWEESPRPVSSYTPAWTTLELSTETQENKA